MPGIGAVMLRPRPIASALVSPTAAKPPVGIRQINRSKRNQTYGTAYAPYGTTVSRVDRSDRKSADVTFPASASPDGPGPGRAQAEDQRGPGPASAQRRQATPGLGPPLGTGIFALSLADCSSREPIAPLCRYAPSMRTLPQADEPTPCVLLPSETGLLRGGRSPDSPGSTLAVGTWGFPCRDRQATCSQARSGPSWWTGGPRTRKDVGYQAARNRPSAGNRT